MLLVLKSAECISDRVKHLIKSKYSYHYYYAYQHMNMNIIISISLIYIKQNPLLANRRLKEKKMKVLMKVLVIILAALCGLTSGTHSEGPGKCLAIEYISFLLRLE